MFTWELAFGRILLIVENYFLILIMSLHIVRGENFGLDIMLAWGTCPRAWKVLAFKVCQPVKLSSGWPFVPMNVSERNG